MHSFTSVAVALSLAASVAAIPQRSETITSGPSATGSGPGPSGSILSVTFPGGVPDGPQYGSLIGSAGSLTTVALECSPSSAEVDDCYFITPATWTYGPSSGELTSTVEGSYTITQTCDYSSGGGACTLTIIAPSSLLAEETDSEDLASLTQIVTQTTTISLAASEIVVAPVTITAGESGAAEETGSSTSSGESTESTSSGTRVDGENTSTETTRSTSTSGTSGAAPSTTDRGNDARILAPGVVGAGLMGLAAILL